MINFIFKNNHKTKNISLLNQQPKNDKALITTDIHSHLLPGIDDGSQSLEESEILIRELKKQGYHKLITTPHIMQDFYRNTPEIIHKALKTLREYLQEKQVDIEIEAAAEYYLDEYLIQLLENKAEILTFGEQYLLFETSYLNKPNNLFEVIFLMQSLGYTPVLAHPERYLYMQQNYSLADELIDKGVLFQVNLNSLSGYYSKGARLLAEHLIDKSFVNFVGSDCHKIKHLKQLSISRSKKYFAKLSKLPLLNHQL